MSLEKKPSTALSQEQEVGVESGARPSRMLGEPGQHLRMFVGGIVVEDGVDHLAGWHGPLDGCDEADELLMPMARHAAADHLAFEHAERGEQGRRAVAFVIVREGRAFPPLQRKTRLGPVERLDLAFLVDGDHHRVAGRVHVETDDIIKLGGEVGIVGSLEGPDPCAAGAYGQPICAGSFAAKDPIALAMVRGPVQMGDCTGWFAQGALDHGMHLDLRHWRDARRTGLVAQQTPQMPFLGEALLPAPHHWPADADPLGNLQHRQALGGQQDDLRPLNLLGRTPSVLDDPLQVRAMLSREEKLDSPSHSSRLARLCPSVNPPFASVHYGFTRRK